MLDFSLKWGSCLDILSYIFKVNYLEAHNSFGSCHAVGSRAEQPLPCTAQCDHSPQIEHTTNSRQPTTTPSAGTLTVSVTDTSPAAAAPLRRNHLYTPITCQSSMTYTSVNCSDFLTLLYLSNKASTINGRTISYGNKESHQKRASWSLN